MTQVRQPVITVVVVSDYNSAAERTWNDERSCLESIAAQDMKEPFEVIIAEDDKYSERFPDELLSIVPGSRVIFARRSSSYGLKNAGVRAAETPIVALLDADCKPERDWLRIVVDTMRAHPGIAALSGRTFYEGKGLDTRVLALLTRSYLDAGASGETRFVSNNAGAFRREVFLTHQLPEHLGAFSSRMQSESIRRDGGILWFEPGLRVVHEFEGWSMEADIRRNIGYGTIATRIAEPRMPHALLIRLGILAMPLVAAGKLFNTWRDCIRCGSAYGVRWFELPVAMGAAVILSLLEIPGMLAAYRRSSLQYSAYR